MCKSFFPFLFILLGIIEAIWGLGQLYGVVLSRHDQFLLTGSFYNPGPYTGFLAMIFPITFYEWLHQRKEPKSIAGNAAWAAMLLIGCLIPCGMSRTAWLAVLASTAYIVLMHESKRIVAYWEKYRQRRMLLSSIALIGLVVAASAAYGMKKDSADGRLLMWKVAVMAVFVFVTGLNVYKAQTDVKLSDAQLKNVEALATAEGACVEWVDKNCYDENDFSKTLAANFYAICAGETTVPGGKTECGNISIYEPKFLGKIRFVCIA